jgi:hypothetical protein
MMPRPSRSQHVGFRSIAGDVPKVMYSSNPRSKSKKQSL